MKQTRPITFVNGKLVTPEGVVEGTLRIADGMIASIGAGEAQPDDEVVDAKGKLLVPGIVDLGVFAVDKPAFHFGGISRAALMPDQSPPLDLPSRVNYIAKSGKPDFWVHPLAAATRGLGGEELGEVALMREAGARGIATGRRWIADSGVMLRVLSYAAMLDMVVVVHAEDGGLAVNAVASAGEMATRLGLPSAPPQAEALAVARDIALAEMAMAGGIGAEVEWHQDYTQAQWWFGEDQGRYIVTVPDTQALNEALAKGTENEDTASIGFRRIGKTGGDTLFGKTIAELKAAHTSFFTEWMEG